MPKYQNYVVDSSGNAVAGASVTVTSYPSNGAVTLYQSDEITPVANPVTTDASGAFSFYAPAGRYNLAVTGSGITPYGVTDILVVGATRHLESITCTQSGGALTFTVNPTVMDMRSATLTSGVPQTVSVNSAVSLTLPSGGTLGFPTTVSGSIIVVLMSNGEPAIVALSGGNDLSETGVINTTAISASSTANNVFYSTTARTGLAYRVVGAVAVVNTAGAWGNPTLVQPYGGQALAAMSSLGYGQTWQNVTGSRVSGTTYYNTTGKPITVDFQNHATVTTQTLTINGSVVQTNVNVSGNSGVLKAVIPPGASYSISSTGITAWFELR